MNLNMEETVFSQIDFGPLKKYLENEPKYAPECDDFGQWFEEKINEYKNIKLQSKELDERAKAIENSLKNELGNAESGSISKFLVLWKSVKSNRIDSKKLKTDYPEIYKAVCKESVSRRFEIKESVN